VYPSIITAVLASNEGDINRVIKKVKALDSRLSRDRFSIFKRVANISKDVDLDGNLTVDEELFEKDIESQLYSEYRSVVSKSYRGYEERLEALFGLGSTLDRYFD